MAIAATALTVASAALAILVPVPPYRPSAETMPCAHYAWAQPGAAHQAIPYAQPPKWIQIAIVPPPLPVAGYAWAQPGALVNTTASSQAPACRFAG